MTTATARLTADEQRDMLTWLLKGASPFGACQQLDLPIERFWQTLAHDPGFAALVQQVYDTLGLNIVSAIYQAAMKGNVSAQQTWLKHRPVIPWTRTNASDLEDGLEELPDGDLIDQCRTGAVDLPPEVAARVAPPAG